MGGGDPRERLGRGREGADARARGSQPPQLRVRRRVRAQVDAGVVLCEPLEQRPPVADRRVQRRLVGIVVELDAIAAPRVLEPCSPERLGVAERGVEVDGDAAAGHATTRRAARPSTYTPTSTPAASMSTSSDGALPSRDERLMHLVRHGVGDADGHRRQLPAQARGRAARRARRTPRRGRSSAARDPSRRGPCRDRGSTTARRSRRPRRRPAARRRGRVSRRNGRLGPDIGGRVREPGASPGRSRRCEGRRCPTTMPLADAGKAVEQGAPSQKTCRPSIRTPRGRRIRVSTHSHAPRGRGARARDRGLRLGRDRSRACRRQEQHDLRRDATARVGDDGDWARSSRPASAASSTTTSR